MPVPLLDLKPQYIPLKAEIQAAIERICDSQYFIMGPEVTEMETKLAAYCQTDDDLDELLKGSTPEAIELRTRLEQRGELLSLQPAGTAGGLP